MSGVTGKVVVVTGASSGIGEATVLLLAERGARLVLGARRTERLAELTARIESAGGEAVHLGTDVTRIDDLRALVALAGERFGRLDVLVGNAGVGTISPLDDLRTDEWDHMVDVNIKGVLNGIGAALPVFRAQGSGHFVTMASTAASRVVPAMAVYAGTKAAVRAICEGLRQEAGPNLRVTTVSPGLIATDFAEASSNDRVRGDITRMRDEVAIEPAAVARAVAYAIEQPADVDVNEIVIRPTAQS
ncbi:MULTISPECIES: SDR family oxidoreductase [unclassified Streptomyces]|uniref:SDR family oxidoreductase n=1 Tax=unclassified Streptomyces TaxID=2593676 RepID=UPI002252197B|nr:MULTISPECIES: SDR family oxidoreductase [unclassified Streptomyces]WSW10019.1 SDR family oxidoreductase [Streptomyces sp. NBC_01005]WTB52070.1 SDR family oxidoreductase [Streptomyces sp. NBC_00826]WTC99528.1 SDR family oxidoreductase [Streptomyces sp. NBC_01650]WTH95040.1 SDR family oxidoreductase [Streptomyces sp. NBC_00825]WTI03774.1 SDR family oxidoreductase [Streptomyces sp. NBC_00822]